MLLVWPLSLSSDYSPQVIPAYDGLSFAAVLGFLVVVTVPALIIVGRRRAPAISFTAALAALSFLPTSNLLFAGGVILAERNPYLDAAHAIFLLSVGDTTEARPLIARLSTRTETPAIRMSLRAQFLFDLRRGNLQAAHAALDSARQRFPGDESWSRQYLQ